MVAARAGAGHDATRGPAEGQAMTLQRGRSAYVGHTVTLPVVLPMTPPHARKRAEIKLTLRAELVAAAITRSISDSLPEALAPGISPMNCSATTPDRPTAVCRSSGGPPPGWDTTFLQLSRGLRAAAAAALETDVGPEAKLAFEIDAASDA